MKIILAIPGHLKTVPMGRFSQKALIALGHEVILFDYKDSLIDKITNKFTSQHEEKASVNKRLRVTVDKHQPDVFITIFGFDISKESLDWLKRKNIPTACWWINDPFQYQRSLKKAHHYDAIFTNSSRCVDSYHEVGINKAFFLPTACDPDIHRSMPKDPTLQADVCFAGDWSLQREEMINLIIDHDINIRVFGPWKKKIAPNSKIHAYLHNGFFTPEQMSSMFSNATITLNLHTWHSKFDHGLNPRVFEASACGTIQIVDWKQEIPSLFDMEKEIYCYSSTTELPELINTILNKSSQEKSEMKTQAQLRCTKEHTYEHRMQYLLNHLLQ